MNISFNLRSLKGLKHTLLIIVLLFSFSTYAQLKNTMNGMTKGVSSSLSGLWQLNDNDTNIYYKTGYVGIGIYDAQSILHINSLKRRERSLLGDFHVPTLAVFTDNSDSKSTKGPMLDPSYYLSTFQMTNKSTDTTASDGFLLELINKDIRFNLRESGSMEFGTNGKMSLGISSLNNVFIGGYFSNSSKLTVAASDEGGLYIKSTHNTKENNSFLIKAKSLDSRYAFIVRNDGNVGIGTYNPSAKLHVKGKSRIDGGLMVNGNIATKKIYAEEVEVRTDALDYWPDYVFTNNYSLMGLQDLENYITKNNHLPEIPTASEIERDGIKLGEMNTLLLKKIEELTLYTIDQEKSIKEQNDILKQQQKLIEGLLERLEKLEKK